MGKVVFPLFLILHKSQVDISPLGLARMVGTTPKWLTADVRGEKCLLAFKSEAGVTAFLKENRPEDGADFRGVALEPRQMAAALRPLDSVAWLFVDPGLEGEMFSRADCLAELDARQSHIPATNGSSRTDH